MTSSYNDNSELITIVIPTYNEIENIKPVSIAVANSLKEFSWKIIFVDDNSPDGTYDEILKLSKKNNKIACIKRVNQRGLSSACVEGILASNSPYIAVMDADMQHDESILSQMLKLMLNDDTDLVIATRYKQGGNINNLKPHRIIISKLSTWISQIVLRQNVSDPMSGFFLIKKQFFMQIRDRLTVKGYKILLDILASSDALKIAEVPYIMRTRHKGKSKLNLLVVFEYISLILEKLFSGKKLSKT